MQDFHLILILDNGLIREPFLFGFVSGKGCKVFTFSVCILGTPGS